MSAYRTSAGAPAPEHPLAEVWDRMSTHFLDADDRQFLVGTARVCVEANLTVRQARAVWRYDVSRAVGYSIGAWAGFERTWLLERVQRLRARWDNQPGTFRWLRYWFRSLLGRDRHWRAIARIMKLLLAERDPVSRARLGDDLHALAEGYFSAPLVGRYSFAPKTYADRTRLSGLYLRHFRRLVAPVVRSKEEEPFHARAMFFLGAGPNPFPSRRGASPKSAA